MWEGESIVGFLQFPRQRLLIYACDGKYIVKPKSIIKQSKF